ncbi:MAG: sensor histidine kinase [Candidatus Accumulibacter meliphilus]|jgi:signal transduction histidine kinase|uniref:histidine kinase n=1 Tax=Candidatus Accumulibacter meliphilus TaxID=2211374 RepID=A0A369XMD9_9PROT|nr:MAG: sensor histidine kinase [Candidatus Accumulibacter meliphilus]
MRSDAAHSARRTPRTERLRRSFSSRLTMTMALLLLAYGALVGVLGWHVAAEDEQESLQRLSHGLARHIVEHWPEITVTDRDQADRAARDALLSMLMVVNPGIQVYVLDADGRVQAYIGDPGMVQQEQVDLRPVRAFLGGAALPLRGSDPMGSGLARIFSAAMFPPRAGDSRPPGYLYIVLDGQAREAVSVQLSQGRVWQSTALVAGLGLLVTLAVGAFTLRRLTQPLHRLARRMRDYSLHTLHAAAVGRSSSPGAGDEVQAIGAAFDEMTERIESQAAREQQQASAHRETMASVAHDLRTPLTALHGHLEALAGKALAEPGQRQRVLAAALAQSDKVRRLSQQLFELAALQSSDQLLHRERFRLDELVTDAVQKFEVNGGPPPVTLAGEPPGRLELEGDLQLVERALTNLIDNALRHAPGAAPVRVSLSQDKGLARITVEDGGGGLPEEVWLRLENGQSLRDPPLRRSSGGIGGLGLAIAQRVAALHGGSLRPLPSPGGGTRLCLALPLAQAQAPAQAI